MTPLDQALLAAHAAGDTAALVDLYAQAAEMAKAEDSAAFYLTHAYVFALEIDHPDTNRLHQKLCDAGRDAPLPPRRQPRR